MLNLVLTQVGGQQMKANDHFQVFCLYPRDSDKSKNKININ